MRKTKNKKQQKKDLTAKLHQYKKNKKKILKENQERYEKWLNLPQEEWTEERKKYIKEQN